MITQGNNPSVRPTIKKPMDNACSIDKPNNVKQWSHTCRSLWTVNNDAFNKEPVVDDGIYGIDLAKTVYMRIVDQRQSDYKGAQYY